MARRVGPTCRAMWCSVGGGGAFVCAALCTCLTRSCIVPRAVSAGGGRCVRGDDALRPGAARQRHRVQGEAHLQRQHHERRRGLRVRLALCTAGTITCIACAPPPLPPPPSLVLLPAVWTISLSSSLLPLVGRSPSAAAPVKPSLQSPEQGDCAPPRGPGRRLQLYRFGQAISIVFFTQTWRPDSFYDRIKVRRCRLKAA